MTVKTAKPKDKIIKYTIFIGQKSRQDLKEIFPNKKITIKKTNEKNRYLVSAINDKQSILSHQNPAGSLANIGDIIFIDSRGLGRVMKPDLFMERYEDLI